jgi:acetyl-CoA carboxylase carboxyltransferase component
VILYVRPPWTVAPEDLHRLARRLTPATRGLGLEKTLLRIREPGEGGELRDADIEVTALGAQGLTVRRTSPSKEPIEPLTPYRQTVVRMQRRGAVYPYELIKMLTPSGDTDSSFPGGTFEEYDLDREGRLEPVTRPYGENSANLVVGLIRNTTAKHPEGMARVVIVGDPSHSLGSLAEPECTRILRALDLARREQLPVEWFALSSGAKISMTSGTENMDWIAAVLRKVIEFTQGGGEINVVVTGVNVGAQPYWNAEATMLMHTQGILVMVPESAMVLTGKQALDFSGGVSAEDNLGIGGFDRVMGPNGQAQYFAPDVSAACDILLRHYEHSYVAPGERFPRRARTADPVERDIRTFPHPAMDGSDFTQVGDVFSDVKNPERKKPFEIRAMMRAVTDADHEPLERWQNMLHADTAVVWDAHIGGIPVALLGFESHLVRRRGFVPADGPAAWTSGTLFPMSSKKTARAINAASGSRPLVVLANLSGFDGSPESMRLRQLEFGAEIGRAVTNFRGPMIFCVVSRYHGGAFVVFSKALNDGLEIAAVEGSRASVIGGAPAAAVVFAREVDSRTDADPRVIELAAQLDRASGSQVRPLSAELDRTRAEVRSEKLGEVAMEFDGIHDIQRAKEMGSVDRIISGAEVRPYIVDALERGMRRELERQAPTPDEAISAGRRE